MSSGTLEDLHADPALVASMDASLLIELDAARDNAAQWHADQTVYRRGYRVTVGEDGGLVPAFTDADGFRHWVTEAGGLAALIQPDRYKDALVDLGIGDVRAEDSTAAHLTPPEPVMLAGISDPEDRPAHHEEGAEPAGDDDAAETGDQDRVAELPAGEEVGPPLVTAGPGVHWAPWSPRRLETDADGALLDLTVDIATTISAWVCESCAAASDRIDDFSDGGALRCTCGSDRVRATTAVLCGSCNTLILLRSAPT